METLAKNKTRINNDLNNLFSKWVILKTNSKLISTQGNFCLELLDTLPEDQAVLKQHINEFDNTSSNKILGIYQHMISLSLLLRNFYTLLLPLANDIDLLDPNSLEYNQKKLKFDNLLEEIIYTVTSENNSRSYLNLISSTYDDLSSLRHDIMEDKSRFNAAYNIINDKIENEISELGNTLKDIETTLMGQGEDIINDIINLIPKVAEFSISLSESIITYTTLGGLVINIGVDISQSTLALINYDTEYKAKSEKINDQIRQVKKLLKYQEGKRLEFLILSTINKQVDSFSQSINNLTEKKDAFIGFFNNLDNELSLLLSYNTPIYKGVFTEQIVSLFTPFEYVINDCKKYLNMAKEL